MIPFYTFFTSSHATKHKNKIMHTVPSSGLFNIKLHFPPPPINVIVT